MTGFSFPPLSHGKANGIAHRQSTSLRAGKRVAAHGISMRPLPEIPKGSVRSCRFPMWDNKDRPTHVYCDSPTVTGGSYCPKHAELCRMKRGKN